ncbi:hypothetical protein [Streptomyces filamentosus]|uniref:hypothetical protein n=1 Tax=Streptomyces filamentosus TaxID=67294 RepID=UPI0014787D3E|nr:hypothetical protein [Streptomyces filamentosus]
MARCIVPGLAVCLLATACGREEQPEQERVTAEEQCDDTLTPEAARALETVLETEKFSHDPRGGLERVTNALVQDSGKPLSQTPYRLLCRATPPVGSSTDTVSIRFGFYGHEDLLGDVHPRGLHPYDMGVEAHSGPKKAYLFLTCVTPRLEGSDKSPARIRGTLTFNRSKLPDTLPVREAHLTILHSATLAVVRKLGCENDAGLTEKPVFKPLPE